VGLKYYGKRYLSIKKEKPLSLSFGFCITVTIRLEFDQYFATVFGCGEVLVGSRSCSKYD
jgi:hypothetical protein